MAKKKKAKPERAAPEAVEAVVSTADEAVEAPPPPEAPISETTKSAPAIPEPEASQPANDFDVDARVVLGTMDPETTVDLRGSSPHLPPLRDDEQAAREEALPEGDAPATDEEVHEGEQLTLSDMDDESAAQGAPPPDAQAEGEGDVSQSHLRGLVEALVFASDHPMKPGEIAKLASAPSRQIKEILDELKLEYSKRGIQLDEVAGGWTFRTNVQYAPFVRDLTGQKPVKLSRAQLETLAICAYRQPVTRPEVDDIRGVDCGPVLKTLLERDLVRILGKKDEPGRPILYGTSQGFLELFNLKSLKDLPTLREFTELNEESRRVVEEELGEVLEERQNIAFGETPAAEGEAPTRESFEDDPTFDPPAAAQQGEEQAATPEASAEPKADETDASDSETDDSETEAPDTEESEETESEETESEETETDASKSSSYDPADELEFPDDDDDDDDEDDEDDDDDDDDEDDDE